MAKKPKKPVEDAKPVELAPEPVPQSAEVETVAPAVPEIEELYPAKPVEPTPVVSQPMEPEPEPEPREVAPPGPCLWRVSLPGVRVRVTDSEGRFRFQDHMDVKALTAGDAFEEFKRQNGILSTIHTPEIGRV